MAKVVGKQRLIYLDYSSTRPLEDMVPSILVFVIFFQAPNGLAIEVSVILATKKIYHYVDCQRLSIS